MFCAIYIFCFNQVFRYQEKWDKKDNGHCTSCVLCYLGPIYFTNHIFSWYRRPFSTSSLCPSGQTHQFIPLLLFSVPYRHILAAYPSIRQRILLSGRQCSWMAAGQNPAVNLIHFNCGKTHIFRLLLQDSLLGLLFLKHPVLSLLTDLQLLSADVQCLNCTPHSEVMECITKRRCTTSVCDL